MKKIQINTRTSGKFKRMTINGRSHIVTTMMPIRGDISMNGINYPDREVTNSFQQLDMIQAPLGHPTIDGQNVSAKHPVAINSHNVGGFIRNPRKKGKRVFNDFLLDEVTANQSEEGRALIQRIENGEKVGVSTGLSINTIVNKTGTDDFNKPFIKEGSGFNFDHVAILMNEQAAGEHAGTELVLNEGTDDEIYVFNLDAENEEEVSKDEQRDFINELIDEKLTELNHNKPKEVDDMDHEKLVLEIIGNKQNSFTGEDKDKLMSMSEAEIVNALAVVMTDEDAKTLLANSGHDFEGYEQFKANEEGFKAYQAEKLEARNKLVESIVENSDFTAEMLEGKSDDELDVLNKMANPKSVDRAAPGAPPKDEKTVVNCDYS